MYLLEVLCTSCPHVEELPPDLVHHRFHQGVDLDKIVAEYHQRVKCSHTEVRDGEFEIDAVVIFVGCFVLDQGP